MSGGLVKRLQDADFRGPMQHLRGWTDLDELHDDAAATITRQQAEIAALRAALAPFANAGKRCSYFEQPTEDTHLMAAEYTSGNEWELFAKGGLETDSEPSPEDWSLTVQHLLNAHTALSAASEGEW